MREIRMLRSTWRELETEPQATAPALDPTDVAGTGTVMMGVGLRPTPKGVEEPPTPYRRRASPRPYR